MQLGNILTDSYTSFNKTVTCIDPQPSNLIMYYVKLEMCQNNTDASAQGPAYKRKKLKKGHNSHKKCWILLSIELDLYSMNIYLCIKYESNTLIFSKDNEQKPFFVGTGHTDVHMGCGNTIYPHPRPLPPTPTPLRMVRHKKWLCIFHIFG